MLKKPPEREPSKESGLDEAIESKTAETSLGARARFASQSLAPTEKTPLLLPTSTTAPVSLNTKALNIPKIQMVTALPPPKGSSAVVTAQPSSTSWREDDLAQAGRDYHRNVAFYRPRLLDSEGKAMGDSLASTAHVPPPRLLRNGVLPTGARRPFSYAAPEEIHGRFPLPTVQRFLTEDLSGSDSDSGHPLKSVLKWTPAKTSSLPPSRRRIGRVKWRNDVRGSPFQRIAEASDSDGAASAPEFSLLSPEESMFGRRRGLLPGQEIYTATEYKDWNRRPGDDDFAPLSLFEPSVQRPVLGVQRLFSSADQLLPPLRRTFITDFASHSLPPQFIEEPVSLPRVPVVPVRPLKIRSSSLPPNRLLEDAVTPPRFSSPFLPRRTPGEPVPIDSLLSPSTVGIGAGSTTNAPLSGIITIHVLDGRGLKIPDRTGDETDELYCVVEIDGEHRARTSVSSWEQRFQWMEAFEIDGIAAKRCDFYVYSWHPRYKHKLCHRGTLNMTEIYFDTAGGTLAHPERKFALSLEPR